MNYVHLVHAPDLVLTASSSHTNLKPTATQTTDEQPQKITSKMALPEDLPHATFSPLPIAPLKSLLPLHSLSSLATDLYKFSNLELFNNRILNLILPILLQDDSSNVFQFQLILVDFYAFSWIIWCALDYLIEFRSAMTDSGHT